MKVALKVIAGPHIGREFAFDSHDTFIVGRAAHAHFRLSRKDQFFSRSHFLVEVNPPLCRLMDLGSTNGTFVNRKRVTDADLQDGDVIVGGKTRIRVSIEMPAGEQNTRRQVADPQTTDQSDADPSRPPPPVQRDVQRIGPYRLIRELGRGGMGIVYLAHAEGQSTRLALKTIRPDIDIQPRDLEMFLREARVLQSLRHPNIVQFVDLGESAGQLYFAMEYVDGVNAWRDVLTNGPMPPDRALPIMCQVLQALEYAHGQRYIHRDIKPENILLCPTPEGERVKVADFGLARVYHTSRLSGLTLRGEMGGSLAFASPEQLTNYRDATPACDQYSAAATLYTLLTGRYVYDFPQSLNHAVLMILQDDPIPIERRRPDLDRQLAAIIHRALSRDPHERYPSVLAFRQALARFGETA